MIDQVSPSHELTDEEPLRFCIKGYWYLHFYHGKMIHSPPIHIEQQNELRDNFDADLISANSQLRTHAKMAAQLLETNSKSVRDNLTATLRCNVCEAMEIWTDSLVQSNLRFQKELREAKTEFDHYLRKLTQLHQEMEVEVLLPTTFFTSNLNSSVKLVTNTIIIHFISFSPFHISISYFSPRGE
jgi:hypothetical protein